MHVNTQAKVKEIVMFISIYVHIFTHFLNLDVKLFVIFLPIALMATNLY